MEQNKIEWYIMERNRPQQKKNLTNWNKIEQNRRQYSRIEQNRAEQNRIESYRM